MNIEQLLNEMQAESKRQTETSNYGFSHGEFNGSKIRAYSHVINTTCRYGVVQTKWFVNDKKVSRAKLIEMFA